jgi:endonuclease YncB( thermonuclease family)
MYIYTMSTMNHNLQTLRSSDVPFFSLKGTTVTAKVVHIYDGDTFHCIFPLFEKVVKFVCRVEGIDTPELKPSKTVPNRDEVIAKAKKARDRLQSLLTNGVSDENTKLITLTCGGFDKYGRLLVSCENVKETLISEGLAQAYDGGTKSSA